MPEGDSIRTDAARLRPVLSGATIEFVDGNGAVRKHQRALTGARISEIRTQGKHLMIDTGDDITIHVHLGMTGSWHIRTRGTAQDPPRRGGADRLLLVTGSHVVVCEAAPTVEVGRRASVDRSIRRLGPDILDIEFDHQDFLTRVRLLDAATAVAEAITDQRVVSGIGNVYKSEVLFLEGVHPLTPLSRLDDGDLRGLVDRAAAIMYPNATRSGRRTTTGRRDRGGEFWVYDRAGKPCRRCRNGIESAMAGTGHPRVTYWCPQCQSR
ncbi:MAG: hypothetical protein OEX04_15400 [Acidimicrobiia bacterium]|nr:hypothetical protein [Acidimicrobiia bacterium]MDH4308852.1 hypothetical protein [Acidimicrobiia bacterium]